MNELIARQLHQEALAGLAAAEWKYLEGSPDARLRLQSRLSWVLRRMADRLDPVETGASRRTRWAG
jgi:hypothetical protein